MHTPPGTFAAGGTATDPLLLGSRPSTPWLQTNHQILCVPQGQCLLQCSHACHTSCNSFHKTHMNTDKMSCDHTNLLTLHTTQNLLLVSRIDDCCNVDGDLRLSGSGNQFYPVLNDERTTLQMDTRGLERDWTNGQATPRPDDLWPDVRSNMSSRNSTLLEHGKQFETSIRMTRSARTPFGVRERNLKCHCNPPCHARCAS